MELKNKLLVGLLLVAQVSGVTALEALYTRHVDIQSLVDTLSPQIQAKYDKLLKAYENCQTESLACEKTAGALQAFENNLLRATRTEQPTQQQQEQREKINYRAYVEAINTYNNQQSVKADALQKEYIKQHPNQPLPDIEIAEFETMSEADWLHSGQPQR